MGRLGDIADILTAGALIGGGYLIYRAVSGFEMPEFPSIDITLPEWPEQYLPSTPDDPDIPAQPIPGADREIIDLQKAIQDLLDQIAEEESPGATPGFGGGGGGVRNGDIVTNGNGGDTVTTTEPVFTEPEPIYDIGGAVNDLIGELEQAETEMQEVLAQPLPQIIPPGAWGAEARAY